VLLIFLFVEKKYGRVYSGELEMLQVFRGHEDTIQAVIHIPELDQVSPVWGTTRLLSLFCSSPFT